MHPRRRIEQKSRRRLRRSNLLSVFRLEVEALGLGSSAALRSDRSHYRSSECDDPEGAILGVGLDIAPAGAFVWRGGGGGECEYDT
jgi:hypothetical protein